MIKTTTSVDTYTYNNGVVNHKTVINKYRIPTYQEAESAVDAIRAGLANDEFIGHYSIRKSPGNNNVVPDAHTLYLEIRDFDQAVDMGDQSTQESITIHEYEEADNKPNATTMTFSKYGLTFDEAIAFANEKRALHNDMLVSVLTVDESWRQPNTFYGSITLKSNNEVGI